MKTERSKNVGKTIAKAMVEILRAEPIEIISRLDKCRDDLIKTAESDEERVEILRRIAEAKVSILWESNDTSHFLRAWQEIERLGYSSVEREASMLVYFFEFCARDGRDDTSCIESLVRFERLVAMMPETAKLHFESVHERIRAKLSANSTS